MSKPFFENKCYKVYCLISERLKTKNTRKNIRLYLANFIKCVRLADRAYGSIGFDKKTGKYAWAKQYEFARYEETSC